MARRLSAESSAFTSFRGAGEGGAMRTFLKIVFVLYAALFVLAVTAAFVDMPAHGPYQGVFSALVTLAAGFPWSLVLVGLLKSDQAIRIGCAAAGALNLFILHRAAFDRPRAE
jgi:hypothetical protein